MYAHATHITDGERKNRSHQYARVECETILSSGVPHKAEEAFQQFRYAYNETVVMKDYGKSFSSLDQAEEEFDLLQSSLSALLEALEEAESELIGEDFGVDGHPGNSGDSLALRESKKIIAFLEVSLKIAVPVEEARAIELSHTEGMIPPPPPPPPVQNDVIKFIEWRKSITCVYVHQGRGLKIKGCLRVCRLRLLRRKAYRAACDTGEVYTSCADYKNNKILVPGEIWEFGDLCEPDNGLGSRDTHVRRL
jgi:hypothetical protein